MRFFVILAAEIFLAAMAVFGVYCALHLLLDGRRVKYRAAIEIQNENDIITLESMILQADNSFFSSRRERYALLIDYDIEEALLEKIPAPVLKRAEIYYKYIKNEKADMN